MLIYLWHVWPSWNLVFILYHIILTIRVVTGFVSFLNSKLGDEVILIKVLFHPKVAVRVHVALVFSAFHCELN